jgi:F-type H+-transporting ATPase subunit delta
VIDQGVAKRYAVALFGAAKTEGVVQELLGDLESLEAMVVVHDPRLVKFLESPQELDEDKVNLVHRLFDGRTTPLFVRLILLLLRKKRILHLLDTIKAYRRLVEESQGVTEAIVTTAVKLPEDLEARLQAELARLFAKKVVVRKRIDPAIIGGMYVMIEGKIIDRSLRSEIAKLRDDLLAVRVH